MYYFVCVCCVLVYVCLWLSPAQLVCFICVEITNYLFEKSAHRRPPRIQTYPLRSRNDCIATAYVHGFFLLHIIIIQNLPCAYACVRACVFPGCITQEGDGVVINQPAQFAKVVLPKYYKHNNYQSFVRQVEDHDSEYAVFFLGPNSPLLSVSIAVVVRYV